jgi:hypothetical protein
MTTEKILEMARDSGIEEPWNAIPQLKRFAAMVAAHERSEILSSSRRLIYWTQNDYDSAIRARGQTA